MNFQRGVALITAIVLVAIATILAVHIGTRAALESIAFQSAELLTAMQGDAASELTELRVDGGAARNDLLMQFQADLVSVPVVRPALPESSFTAWTSWWSGAPPG